MEGLKIDKVTLAVIQSKVSEDKEETLSNVKKDIIKAAKMGADIVVLPEMFNCPYDSSQFYSYAESYPDGPTLKMLSKTAAENKIYLFGGSIPELKDGKLYNTCFIFGQNGELLSKYSKTHLFDVELTEGVSFKESSTLQKGDHITVVETKFGKIGVLICYDIRFPEMARILTKQGARLLVVPAAFNMVTGPAHWELTMRARALDNQMFVAAAAPARDVSAKYVSYGHSMVVDPWGKVIKALDEKEGIIITEINFDRLNQIRQELPLLKHLRNKLYSENTR